MILEVTKSSSLTVIAFAAFSLMTACGGPSETKGTLLSDRRPPEHTVKNKIGVNKTLCLMHQLWTEVHMGSCTDDGTATNEKFLNWRYMPASGRLYVESQARGVDFINCLFAHGTLNEKVEMRQCNPYDPPNPSTQFHYDSVRQGFVHKKSGLCLNVNNGYPFPGTPLVLNTCATNSAGKFIDKQHFWFDAPHRPY